MVDLEMIGSILESRDEERMQRWEQHVKDGLDARISMCNLHYTCMLKKVMFGVYVMIFVRSDCQQNVHQLQTVKVKTGVKGYAANKGAVSLRFNYDDTSFMLLNCHLTSGQSKTKQRLDDISQ